MSDSMFDLKRYLESRRQWVDQALLNYLGSDDASHSRLGCAMHYSVMAGGKRLRPVLCLAAAETIGGTDPGAVVPLACALEMIHTYSLIHDDLPAMDDDEKRRGRPTCHIQFDEATAILAGDALLTLAFELLATAGKSRAENPQRWLQCIAEIAAAAGFRGMIEGQMQDMAFEGEAISIEALESLHGLKTGRMIEVAVFSGATIAGASRVQLDALYAYARHIGLAFQVADDILNVKGDPKKLGKATGTDQLRGKNTYPSLMGLEASETLAGELVDRSVKALEIFDHKADPLRAIARYVIERER